MSSGFRTLVFCTSYIPGQAQWDERYARWLSHHAGLPWEAPLMCMVDDGSPFVPDAALIQTVGAGDPLPDAPSLPLRVRFPDRLGRSGMHHYPGWWRSFLHSVFIARHYGCDKIVHVESDAYVLSSRMTSYISSRTSGWTAFWCPRWDFPETAIQVMCRDQFATLEHMWEAGWERYDGLNAEFVLPFTEITRDPHGDRYSEFRSSIPGYADFAVQVPASQKIWFR